MKSQKFAVGDLVKIKIFRSIPTIGIVVSLDDEQLDEEFGIDERSYNVYDYRHEEISVWDSTQLELIDG